MKVTKISMFDELKNNQKILLNELKKDLEKEVDEDEKLQIKLAIYHCEKAIVEIDDLKKAFEGYYKQS